MECDCDTVQSDVSISHWTAVDQLLHNMQCLLPLHRESDLVSPPAWCWGQTGWDAARTQSWASEAPLWRSEDPEHTHKSHDGNHWIHQFTPAHMNFILFYRDSMLLVSYLIGSVSSNFLLFQLLQREKQSTYFRFYWRINCSCFMVKCKIEESPSVWTLLPNYRWTPPCSWLSCSCPKYWTSETWPQNKKSIRKL